MALMQLPNELLEQIVMHTLPEGFESVALTCTRIYALCTPFIEHHNTLRARFRSFDYCDRPNHQWGLDQEVITRTGFDLLTRIAVEPIVSRYIREADFKKDGIFRPSVLVEDAQPDGPVGKLLAQSPYLKQAGLDWQQYFAKIKEEEGPYGHWSQHAAVFLLTLLPNVEKLTPPKRWEASESTDKLIEAIVRRTRRPSSLPYGQPSLARCTTFGPVRTPFDLDMAKPFLALPWVREFSGCKCVGIKDNGCTSSLAQNWPYNFGHALEVAKFWGCYIDHVAIADFLKHTPRLRSLTYSHRSKDDSEGSPQDWDICNFVTAIEREVGGHLMQLCLVVFEARGSLLTGRTSLRGFTRLQKLKFPLELVTCNITAAVACQLAKAKEEPMSGGSINHQAPKAPQGDCAYESSFVGDFVPASVSQLSLISSGTDEDVKVLDVMFRYFAAEKNAGLSALEEIHVSCTSHADEAYKAQWARLRTEMEELGVVCRLKEFD